jgi:hypothetical protein
MACTRRTFVLVAGAKFVRFVLCLLGGMCTLQPDYVALAKGCNLDRNCHDMTDSWDSVKSIVECFGDNEGDFASVAGPGFFNDPDMVSRLFKKEY